MRARWGAAGLVWLLASWGPARAERPAAEIDLGTGTLDAGELSLGPVRIQGGITDWLTAGTYPVPWGVSLIDPASRSANGFAKAEVLRRGRWSASMRSGAVYARLDDIDGDGLGARAWLFPSSARLGARLTGEWAVAAELTWVYARIAASRLQEADPVIAGVAIANSAHGGLVVRYALSRRLTLWARARVLLGHTPVLATGGMRLSRAARLEVRARAEAADLSTTGAATAGLLATLDRFNVRFGLGYGHWIVPMVELPVGESLPSVDLDLYWRF